MPLVLNENAANVNVLITIVDDNNNGIPDIEFDDPDLAIYYFKDSATAWVQLTLVAGALGSWISSGFVELPDSDGEYLLSLPAAAITARKTTMLKIVYGTNKPLRDIVTLAGPPAFPANFSALLISGAGKVTTNPNSLQFNMRIPPIPISLNGEFSVFVGETAREIVLTANQDVSAIPLKIVFERPDKTDLAIVEDDDLTKVAETVSFTLPSDVTDEAGLVRWAIRHNSNGTVYGNDEFSVNYAPLEDIPPPAP